MDVVLIPKSSLLRWVRMLTMLFGHLHMFLVSLLSILSIFQIFGLENGSSY